MSLLPLLLLSLFFLLLPFPLFLQSFALFFPLLLASLILLLLPTLVLGPEEGREGGREGKRELVSAEMQCLPPTSVVGRASAKLNDRMAVGASQVLAWLAVPHLGCPPNGGLMRFILDESHQKGSDYITSCQSCLLIQHYSCLCSDCTGFHTSKPRVVGWREGKREGRRSEADCLHTNIHTTTHTTRHTFTLHIRHTCTPHRRTTPTHTHTHPHTHNSLTVASWRGWGTRRGKPQGYLGKEGRGKKRRGLVRTGRWESPLGSYLRTSPVARH